MEILKKMRILLILVAVALLFSVEVQAKKKKGEDNPWRYEIECAGTGVQGTYLIKVWSYSKKPHLAIEKAKKNAVHGVIFKGYVGGQGCNSQKPLARNPTLEEEKADFFKEFFADNGKYMKFVSLSSDGSVAAGDRLKLKKEYKVGVVVAVRKDELRKDLEAAGIIKGLSSGF